MLCNDFLSRLEFDNNGGSDDEQLKDELLRIFDRERLGLESYFKQKTENILAGYRRKQYDWEENIRLERIEYEKTLAQEKIEVNIFIKCLICAESNGLGTTSCPTPWYILCSLQVSVMSF